MRILLLMIPISIVLLGIAICAFVWAVRRGQFDDLDTPALDILVEDDGPRPKSPPPQQESAGRRPAPCPPLPFAGEGGGEGRRGVGERVSEKAGDSPDAH